MIVKPIDIETTIFNKGNAFDNRNEACFVGVGNKVWDIAYSSEPYGNKLIEIQQEIDEADLLLFVNAKFDLHWIANLGIKFQHKKIWDCQLVFFMLSNQTHSYPSMNDMSEAYGLDVKPSRIHEYWENEIDTKQIPKHEIVSYLQEHDLPTTSKIYEIQKELVKDRGKSFERLVSLHNQDLLVLQEIEYNGLMFDEQKCLDKAEELNKQLSSLRSELYSFHNIPDFNTESGDHVSCLLYGGTIIVPRKELVGKYVSGNKKGLDKYGWVEYSYFLPQLVKPLPRTELKKKGYYQTNEDTLKTLKATGSGKKVIDIILQLSKIEKIVGTYYLGLPKLREKMNWKESMLHGNLNQCVARTGRLSSAKPNLQNLDGTIKSVFETRFSLRK